MQCSCSNHSSLDPYIMVMVELAQTNHGITKRHLSDVYWYCMKYCVKTMWNNLTIVKVKAVLKKVEMVIFLAANKSKSAFILPNCASVVILTDYPRTLLRKYKLDLAFNNLKPKDWYFVLDYVRFRTELGCVRLTNLNFWLHNLNTRIRNRKG